MKPLVLIGANGQVGWEVSRQASAAGIPCIKLTRDELDITCRELVFSAVRDTRPLVVVNAAAYTDVDKAESEIDAALAVNRDGARFIAEACTYSGAPLIHLSTDYVFDGAKADAYNENDCTEPLGVYGASKLAGEEAVQEHCPEHVILRTSWVYGVHGHNFVRTMLRLSCERETISVVDDQSGCPTFAGDLGAAILKLVVSLQSGMWPERGYGIFHCAAQGVTTWCRFAREIFKQSSLATNVEAIKTVDFPTPARRPRSSVLDCTKLREVHGISLRPWQLGLKEMLNEWSQQPRSAQTRSAQSCKPIAKVSQ